MLKYSLLSELRRDFTDDLSKATKSNMLEKPSSRKVLKNIVGFG